MRSTSLPDPAPRRSSGRWLLVAVALLLAVAAAARFGDYRGGREELVAQVAPLLAPEQSPATDRPTNGGRAGSVTGRAALALDRLRREPDPEQAKVLAARALVRQVLTEGATLGRADRLDRLALARQLTSDAMARRPASWGASTLLGASTYLGWAIARDNRLLMEAPAWEGPLWRATTLGPGKSEPASFLSMAYLELWPTLPESKKVEARELLRQGFEDRETFERLIGAWLATADDLEDALALVPPQPYAWSQARHRVSMQRNWRGYALATERWHEVLAADFEQGIVEAEARLAAGDVLGARDRLLEILREMPTDRRYAETFSRVMRLLPAGLPDSHTVRIFSRWLAWVRELSRTGTYPLSPEVIDRLARATEPSSLAEEAESALLAGHFNQAERAERRSEERWQPEWAPYFIAKSRLLTERGQLDAARAELEQVSPSGQSSVAYWSARVAIERAGADETAIQWTAARLEALRADRWPTAAWDRQFTLSRLDLLTPAATGLALSIDHLQRPDLAVAVRWDGQEIAILPAADAPLRIPLDIEPGHHLLELEALGGGEVTPGTVRLVTTSG